MSELARDRIVEAGREASEDGFALLDALEAFREGFVSGLEEALEEARKAKVSIHHA